MIHALWVVPLIFAFWCVLSALLAWLDGWRALARHYRAVGLPTGQTFSWQSGRIGWLDYNGCLTIRVCEDGLYLAVWPPVVFSHPPLLLPWSKLHVVSVRDKWWGRDVTLTVGTPPLARIRLPLKVLDAADRLRPPGVRPGADSALSAERESTPER